MIFVDTGAWYAAFIENDPDHERAEVVLAAPGEPLLTTDYVLDELFTLFKARGCFETARAVGEQLLTQQICCLELVREQDIHNAWSVFYQFRDKEWSFTDCVSRVVMARLGISKAFSFDHHFSQFGNVKVLP